MSLRFYLAGSAESDHSSNWRCKITDRCRIEYNDQPYDTLQYNLVHAESDLVAEGVLPGGFDYAGAYIFGKGHNLYSDFQAGFGMMAIAPLHKQCLDICDVVWVWLDGCGQGTWLEVGYAVARETPVVFAASDPHTDDHDDLGTFTDCFVGAKQTVIAPTAHEAWALFAAKPMKYLRYADYLKTPHWKATRAAVFDSKGHFCARCHATLNLQMHHLTYERVGREAYEDLIPLCATCHQLEHGKEGAR